MSSHYKDKRMDDEWAYLLKYHYASVDTAKAHRRSHIYLEDETPHLYRRVGQAQYDSLSVPLILDQTVFGRISVLQRDRKLNYGDQQLLELLASGLKRSLSEQRDEDMPYNEDCFTLLLENKLTVQEELSYQLAFFKWKRKSKFQLFLLESPDLAITEAAVGAGVTSILFFVTLKKIHAIRQESEKEEDDEPSQKTE